MSWHFSQALEAEYLRANCLDGEPSPPWKSMPSAPDDSCSDKMKGTFHRSPFGMMYVPSTDAHGAALLTWYLEAFPVRTLARQEGARGSTDPRAVYGMRWLGSFAKYSRDTSSWKTAQNLLLADSDEYSEAWPKWGLMRNGVSSELVTLARRMSAKEYGFVPTPTASNTKAHHMRGADKGKAREARSYGDRGPLNPEYLEWLMGWPVGWTGLGALETAKFREWLRQHSLSLPADSNEKAA
jgi:hypothetical protein